MSVTNRKIDALLDSAVWAIDPSWGLSQLNNYLSDLDLVSSGTRYSDLGYSEIRANSRKISIYSEDGGVVKVDPEESTPGEDEISAFAKVSLNGVMKVEDGAYTVGMKSLSEHLMMLDETPGIKGILLEANTGGGEALAGELLHNAISSLKTPLITYAYFLGSAGVFATVNSKEIIAAGKQSMIGSIGSMITINKEAIEEYRKNFDAIYAEQSPDKNNTLRSYLSGDKGPMQDVVNKSAKIFQDVVKRNRPLRGNTENTLSGGMFFADLAKRRGLIDSIGTMSFAIKRLKSYF